MPATDTELVAAVLRGDQTGVAGIYDRYADRLHDYAWSVCRSHADAGDIVQDTFITASQRLGQLRDPERLRPWLYAIARNQALRVIRERERVEVSSEIDMTIDFPQPDSGLDAQQLVWDAAAGLDAKDRDILTLHLREGLDGEDLAAALGIKPNAANVALFRVRERLEDAVGAVLLTRFARGGCDELDRMMTGELTPLIRKRATRHIEQCDDCQASRRRIGSPAALFAATPAALAPAALRDTVLSSWGSPIPPSAEIPTWRADGFPIGREPTAGAAASSRRAGQSADASLRRARFAAVGGIAVVAIGVAFFALLRSGPVDDGQLATVEQSPVTQLDAVGATSIAPPPGSAAGPPPAEPATTLTALLVDAPAATTPSVTAPTDTAPSDTATQTVPPAPSTVPNTEPEDTVVETPPTTEPGPDDPTEPTPFPPVAQQPVDQPTEFAGDSVSISVLEFECAGEITVRLLVSASPDPTVTIRHESTSGFITDVELAESDTEPNIYEGTLDVLEGEHRMTARASAGSASDSELLTESCGQIG